MKIEYVNQNVKFWLNSIKHGMIYNLPQHLMHVFFEKLTAKSEKMCNATEHKPSYSYTDFGFSIIQISNDIIFTGPYNLIIIFYKSHYCMYDRLSYVCEFF